MEKSLVNGHPHTNTVQTVTGTLREPITAVGGVDQELLGQWKTELCLDRKLPMEALEANGCMKLTGDPQLGVSWSAQIRNAECHVLLDCRVRSWLNVNVDVECDEEISDDVTLFASTRTTRKKHSPHHIKPAENTQPSTIFRSNPC